MKTRILIILAALLLLASSLPAQQAQYSLNGTTALPDPTVTPGAVNPAVVADLTGAPHTVNGIEMNICARDAAGKSTFRTGPIRASIHNFPGLKRKACAEYGVEKCDASVEGDHLISIEVGGCPDCLTNLWPQPMDEARIKDHELEDVLPGLICAGKISLTDAQQCIATDWVACAGRIHSATNAVINPTINPARAGKGETEK